MANDLAKQIPAFLQTVKWEVLPPEKPSEFPHATHSGVLSILGYELRCYQLSDGQTVFDADDFKNFLEGFLAGGHRCPVRE